MNTTPVQSQPNNSDNSNNPSPPVVSGGSVSAGKEFEAVKISQTESVSEISREPEIPKDVEKAGVTTVSGTIELPPDVKKLGVTQTGASAPVTVTQTLPKVILPISDKEILKGLHEKVTNALRWLSTWCIRKLKKAHIALKEIHGKIIRVQTK